MLFYPPEELPPEENLELKDSNATNSASYSESLLANTDNQPSKDKQDKTQAEDEEHLASAREHDANAQLTNTRRILGIIVAIILGMFFVMLLIFKVLSQEEAYQKLLKFAEDAIKIIPNPFSKD